MIDLRELRASVAGVDTLFRARASEGRAPSASYGVFTREGLVHAGSTGEVAGEAPNVDTIYRIASCTKSFTATALLALRDAGTVSLDDAITDYVPSFRHVQLPTADSPVPTLRMLLTMSAGLPTDDPWGDRQESITDAALDALLGRGLRFDSIPGTRFAYSNLGYALLGRAIAAAAGRAYREVVTTTILEPLGLSSTTFERPEGADDRLAIGHRRVGDAWEPLPFSGPGAFSPIGGLFSSVADLSRWARWLSSAFAPLPTGRSPGLQAGSPSDGDLEGILSRASRRELQQASRATPGLPMQPSGYGFGLIVEEEPGLGSVVSHSGGYPGFSAHMRWHPETGLGIVAFENATAAQVSAPASSGLHGLLLHVGGASSPLLWPETAVARRLVEDAIGGADLPAAHLSENVDLDVSLARRRDAWKALVDEIGGLTVELPTPAGRAESRSIDTEAGDESTAPSHLVWRLPGRTGRLRVEIRLTPESPPRLQTVNVRAERL